MKLICSRKDECADKSCPHRQAHENCGHECDAVPDARCVVDVESLPVYRETGKVAMFIRRREAA